MKRRRQTLQVSTFPFLAVLLCAMGSLILLLLVIDRRAKVVMRAKALAAIRQMESEDANESAARTAEWEQRRRALHEQLQQQKQELQKESATVEGQLAAAVHEWQTEQAQVPALERQLQAEKDNLIHQEKAVASAVQEAKQKRERSQATSAELTRVGGELIKLEQTLDDLKTLRQKQQQTYSLVPYRGRRGDNRRPIYLECTKEALIFHPDRLILPAADSSSSAILDEVERRICHQQPTGASKPEKKESPYLLLLVRPNGIITYYRTLAALRNVKTDFGYEFVEADWVLDFPQNEKANQPWMAAGAAAESDVRKSPEPTQKSPQPAIARLGSKGLNAREGAELATDSPSLLGSLGSAANGGAAMISGSLGGTVSGGSATETSSQTRGKAGNSPPLLKGLPGFPDSGDLYRLRHFASLPTAMGIDRLQRPGETEANGPEGQGAFPAGSTISGPHERSGGTPGNGQPRGDVFASTPGPGGANPSEDQGKSQSAGSGSLSSSGHSSFQAETSSPSVATPFSREPIGGRSSSMSGSAPPFSFPDSKLGAKMEGNETGEPAVGARHASDSTLISGKSSTSNDRVVNGSPSTNATVSAPSLIPNFDARPSESSGQSGNPSGGANRIQASEPEETGAQSTGPPGLGQTEGPPTKKLSAPAVVHRYVGRDWNIFVECAADHVVVYPGGLQVPLTSIGSHGNTQKESLLQTIQQMIVRRQAVVASAETSKDAPQSPQIRFLVRPDGLRTYFFAYPELATLHLSMTRENLDAHEDAVRHLIGR